MTTQDSKIEFVILRLNAEVAGADARIAKFTERLSNNPVYAFEWANEAILASATKQNCERLLRSIEFAKSKVNDAEAKLDAEMVEEIMGNLDRHFAHEISRGGVSDSTSGSHRLMNTARIEVAAKWFDAFGGWGLVDKKLIRDGLLELIA